MSKTKKEKKDEKARKARRRKKRAGSGLLALTAQPAAEQASGTTISVPQDALTEDALFQNIRMLETGRTKWQYGEWADLVSLGEEEISRHPDRAKLALLIAAGNCHAGNLDRANLFVRLSAQWGCSATLIGQVLISSVHNTLGRLSASLDDGSSAGRHFETAIRLVEPHADTALLGRTRRIQETTRMGLLPDARNLLGEDLAAVQADPADHSGRIATMAIELELLGAELSLSLRRGQLHADTSQDRTAPPPETTEDFLRNLSRKAVSQLGQDLWVLERSNYKRGGYFVEFGATDGVVMSNTWLLEKEFGWTGLCAEPNPKFFDALQKNRTCTLSSACIGATSGEEVEFILADVYGGIAEYAEADVHKDRRNSYRRQGEVTRLKTVSLDDFLRQHNAPSVIDYLSIDTEGSEFSILETFPFDAWTIRLITVEHNHTPMREQIRALLERHNYRRTQVEFDDWYELNG